MFVDSPVGGLPRNLIHLPQPLTEPIAHQCVDQTSPADPRAVRDAVTALQARKIPRAVVRARTLQRVERDIMLPIKALTEPSFKIRTFAGCEVNTG